MHGPTPPLPLPTDRLQFAMPPMHESAEDERRHRRERLAGALRIFGRTGFGDGVSGHITARDPGSPTASGSTRSGCRLSTSPSAISSSSARTGAGRRGAATDSTRPPSPCTPRCTPPGPTSSPSRTATPCTAAPSPPLRRPHRPPHPGELRLLRGHRPLRLLHRRHRGHRGGPPDRRRLGSRKALVLRNHGLLTVGDSVDAAAWWFLSPGPLLPGAAAGEAAGPAGAHRPQARRRHPRTARRRPGGLDQLPAAVAGHQPQRTGPAQLTPRRPRRPCRPHRVPRGRGPGRRSPANLADPGFTPPGQHNSPGFTRGDPARPPPTAPRRAQFAVITGSCPAVVRTEVPPAGSAGRGEGGRRAWRCRRRGGDLGAEGVHGRLHLRGLPARRPRGTPAGRRRVPAPARRVRRRPGTAGGRGALRLGVPPMGLRGTDPAGRGRRRSRAGPRARPGSPGSGCGRCAPCGARSPLLLLAEALTAIGAGWTGARTAAPARRAGGRRGADRRPASSTGRAAGARPGHR